MSLISLYLPNAFDQDQLKTNGFISENHQWNFPLKTTAKKHEDEVLTFRARVTRNKMSEKFALYSDEGLFLESESLVLPAEHCL